MNSEILKKGIRVIILLALMFVSGYLVYRNNGNAKSCEVVSPCNKCSKLNSCSLPEAKEYKMEKSNK